MTQEFEKIRPNKEGEFPKLKDGHYVLNLGNGSSCEVWIEQPREENGNFLFVSIIGSGAYVFNSYASYGYVNEKLRIHNESDAQNISDFINCQLGINCPKCGRYEYVTQ